MLNIDPGSDTIQYVGDAALDAAGFGFAAPLWDAFFPQGDPVFSQAQLDQLTNLFEQLFQQQYFQQNLDLFTSSTTLCNEYANNQTPDELANLLVQTENTATGLLSNGYSSARVYLSAELLHILALKFAYEAADDAHKAGAAKNIAQAALDTLNNLLVLEEAYGAAEGWQEFAGFKQTIIAGVGSLSSAAVTAFGPTYINQVQKLMGLVSLYDPDSMSQIVHAPYLMLFVPYDATSTPTTWNARSATYSSNVFFYKCQGLPPGVPGNYFPLSDLATIPGNPYPQLEPTFVIYVAANTAKLVTPSGYNQIYNDHGSGNSNDYAGFWTNPVGIGSYSAGDDNASQPDFSNLCQLIDPQYYIQVELSTANWDDSGTGADEDGTVYLHPQFGNFGIYMIERSHSRPDPDTVNGLSMAALSGHPAYTPAS